MQSLKKKQANWIYWGAATLLLLPWVYIQSQMSVNSDVAWLSICAERLINGGTLTNSCYDTNPPLSILVYSPFVWLSALTSIADYHIIFWLTLMPIAFATFAIYHLSQNKILTTAFLASVTIIPSLYYAERDHFIAIMLLPFILLQLSITKKETVNAAFKYTILVLGSLALLLKPHFGLIPIFMLLHRMRYQRRIWVFKDADFIILALSCISYLVIIYAFYTDFLTQILPDVIEFYLGYNNIDGTVAKLKIYGALWAVFCIGCTLLSKDYRLKLIVPCAGLCLLVFTIQMKGFTYHLLPFFALMFPLMFASIPKVNASIVLIAIFAFSYIFSPLRPDYPTHTDYQNNGITNYIAENCAEPCSFYMLHENMDIVSQIAFYTNHTYATRFPAFWFQPQITENGKVRFSRYIAEDLNTFAPSLIFVPQAEQNFFDFYAVSDEFKQAIAPYHKTDELTVDRAFFYKDTKYYFLHILTWDVYTKK